VLFDPAQIWSPTGSGLDRSRRALHHNVAQPSLLPQLARIAWAVLTGAHFEVTEDNAPSIPTCFSVAPCSYPSRRCANVEHVTKANCYCQP